MKKHNYTTTQHNFHNYIVSRKVCRRPQRRPKPMADIAIGPANGQTTVVIHPGLEGHAVALEPSSPPTQGGYMRVWLLEVKAEVMALLVALLLPPTFLFMLVMVLLVVPIFLLMLAVVLARPLLDGGKHVWWRISSSDALSNPKRVCNGL